MGSRLGKSLQFLFAHKWPLFGLSCLIYLPYFALHWTVTGFHLLPDDAASVVFGMIDLVLAPFANGMTIFLIDRWASGGTAPYREAFAAAKRSWVRLLVAYIMMSFILLGMLAVTIIPCFVVMRVAGLNQPFFLAPVAGLVISYVLARYSFLDSLVVLEGLGAYHARMRSGDLTRGHKLRIMGLGVVTLLPPTVLDLGSEIFTSVAPGVNHGIPSVLIALAGPASVALYLWPQVLFYLYYRDLRNLPVKEKS